MRAATVEGRAPLAEGYLTAVAGGRLYFPDMESGDCRSVRDRAFSWAWVLCLALVLRALVPAGYMPDFTSGGMPGVMLCDMQGWVPGHADHPGSGSAYDNPLHFVAQCVGGAPLPIMAAPLGVPFAGFLAVLLFITITPRVARMGGSPLGPRAPPRPFA